MSGKCLSLSNPATGAPSLVHVDCSFLSSVSQLARPVQGRSLKSKTQVAMRKGFSKTGGVAEGFAKSYDI